MSKKSHFRGCFNKQYGKRSKALLKSASQHLYHILWSLRRKFWSKKFLLLTCQTLEVRVSTLATDENDPVLNRDNLRIPIQMQLFRKQKTFSEFFASFLKFRLNLEYFEKKMTFTASVFRKLKTPNTWWDKCLKSPVSEDPLTSNMVNVPQQCWNLHHSASIKFIDHCQVNWIGKRLSCLHAKSWDCLLTHSLPMKSILSLIETF